MQQCAAEDLGIEFEFTAPDTPQQNGVVERAFATQIGREKQPCCRLDSILTEMQHQTLVQSYANHDTFGKPPSGAGRSICEVLLARGLVQQALSILERLQRHIICG